MLEPDVDDGPTGPAADLLRRKVKETLELDLDAPELHDALEVVSEFWQGNTAENRRNLRSDLERRTVEQAEAFVAHYRPLRDALAGSEAMAAELEAHVAATARELRDREAENRRVVAAHDALVAERDALAAKREATVAFLARFQLGERERDAARATSRAEDADDFFAPRWRAAGALADLDRALADGSRCFADAVGCGETVRPSDGVGAELRDLLREATDGAHERLLAFALRALGGDATTAADAAAAAAACEAVAQDPGQEKGDSTSLQRGGRARVDAPGPGVRGRGAPGPLLLHAPGGAAAALLAAVAEGLGEPLAARLRSAVAALGGDVARVHGVARLLAFYAPRSRAARRRRCGGRRRRRRRGANGGRSGAKALGDEVRASDVRRFGPRGDAAAPAARARAGAVLSGRAPDGGDDGDSAGTLLALVLDPVLQSVDAALDAAPLREFAGRRPAAATPPAPSAAAGSAVDAAAWAVDAFGFCAAELEALPRGDVVGGALARCRGGGWRALRGRVGAPAPLRPRPGPRAREARLGAGAASQLGAARRASAGASAPRCGLLEPLREPGAGRRRRPRRAAARRGPRGRRGHPRDARAASAASTTTRSAATRPSLVHSPQQATDRHLQERGRATSAGHRDPYLRQMCPSPCLAPAPMTSPDGMKDDCFEPDCGLRGYKFLSYRLAREAVLRDRPGVVAKDGSKTPYGVFADFGFHGASWLGRRRETRPLRADGGARDASVEARGPSAAFFALSVGSLGQYATVCGSAEDGETVELSCPAHYEIQEVFAAAASERTTAPAGDSRVPDAQTVDSRGECPGDMTRAMECEGGDACVKGTTALGDACCAFSATRGRADFDGVDPGPGPASCASTSAQIVAQGVCLGRRACALAADGDRMYSWEDRAATRPAGPRTFAGAGAARRRSASATSRAARKRGASSPSPTAAARSSGRRRGHYPLDTFGFRCSLLDAAFCALLVLVASRFLLRTQERAERTYGTYVCTPADYTVAVDGGSLPTDYASPRSAAALVGDHFERVLGAQAPVIEPGPVRVADVCFAIVSDRTLVRARRAAPRASTVRAADVREALKRPTEQEDEPAALRDAFAKASAAVQDLLDEGSKGAARAAVAFVTFETEEGFQRCLHAYPPSLRRWPGFLQPRRLKLQGKARVVSGDAAFAFSPAGSGTLTMADVVKDERFEDYGLPAGETGKLGCFCDAVAADASPQRRRPLATETRGALGTWCRGYYRDVWLLRVVRAIAVAFVVAVEVSLKVLAKWTTTFERHPSTVDACVEIKSSNRLQYLRVRATDTYGLLGGAYYDFTAPWYASVGAALVSAIILGVAGELGYAVAVVVMHKLEVCRDRGWSCDASVTRALTQDELVATLAPPRMTFPARYAFQLKVLFVCLLYSGGIPLLWAVACATFAGFYAVDKVLFTKFLSAPPPVGARLAIFASSLAPLAVAAHCLVAAWMLTNPEIFDQDDADGTLMRTWYDPRPPQVADLAFASTSRETSLADRADHWNAMPQRCALRCAACLREPAADVKDLPPYVEAVPADVMERRIRAGVLKPHVLAAYAEELARRRADTSRDGLFAANGRLKVRMQGLETYEFRANDVYRESDATEDAHAAALEARLAAEDENDRADFLGRLSFGSRSPTRRRGAQRRRSSEELLSANARRALQHLSPTRPREPNSDDSLAL
ncbi:hypothetical protein JL720_12374 [Aureococcus anophagefferens]|nr:hypothetical protein JL720_12374 [Aureococcus anophagefferens]